MGGKIEGERKTGKEESEVEGCLGIALWRMVE